jgi:hypothetical protein
MKKGEESTDLMLRTIALRIARKEPSEWLVTHFRHWLPTLALEICISNMMPTRSDALKWLANVETAARFLRMGLGHQPSRSLLQEEKLGVIPNLGELLQQLKFLEERAQCASKSPGLTTGKVQFEGANKHKVSTAGMIILAWEEVRGQRPSPRNRDAWEAADCLWRLSNKLVDEWGILAKFGKRLDIKKDVQRGEDRLTGWRGYYEAALEQQPVFGLNHDEFLRHLRIGRSSELTDLAR